MLGKDSEFAKKEQKRVQECAVKIKRYLHKIFYLKTHNPYKWSQLQISVNKLLNDIRAERILTRTWFHFDMDMFFAACEIQANPALAKIPIAVGD